ncbi:hypothetical protein MP638_002349 [Amoeboaphelidium occidentale]|nr:hypothetical protein MP638_002349 [Amoeboaphelidium occidentale]
MNDFVECVDALEKYLEMQKELSEQMKSAFWNLSRAQHTMGHSRVSTLQVPAIDEMKAQTLLEISSTDWWIVQRTEEEIEQDEDDEEKEAHTFTDPLKWFGVLVPQTLKESQKDFKAALETIVQAAKEQHKARVLMKKLELNRKRK